MKSTYRGMAVESLTTTPTKLKRPKPGDLIQTTLAHVLVKKNVSDGVVSYQEIRQPRGSFMLCVGENQFLWNGEIVTITFQGTDWQLIKEM